jgi:hypothetical protein
MLTRKNSKFHQLGDEIKLPTYFMMTFGKCHYIRLGYNHQIGLTLVTKAESVTIYPYKFTFYVKRFQRRDYVWDRNNFCCLLNRL